MDGRKVTAERLLGTGRFLALKALDWIDASGVARQWETADRVADRGAVLIIPRLAPSDRILLIRQFRPPARAQVWEFPAGLIDAGEDPATAAARELREETGYQAEKLIVHPRAFTTPGMSGEAVFFVEAIIDEKAEANQNPRTDFDPSEMIETHLQPIRELAEFYQRECAAGALFDAKVVGYIMGKMHSAE